MSEHPRYPTAFKIDVEARTSDHQRTRSSAHNVAIDEATVYHAYLLGFVQTAPPRPSDQPQQR